MNLYTQVATEAKHYNEKQDCSVRALAIAAGLSYNMSHYLFKKHGRQNRKATPRHIFHTVLANMKYYRTSYNPALIRANGSRYSSKTIGLVFDKGNYICTTRNHAFALVDGIVQDWTANRRYVILQIYKIEEIF